MTGFWDQFKSTNFDDLDRTLGGIPSTIASKVDPSVYQNYLQRKAAVTPPQATPAQPVIASTQPASDVAPGSFTDKLAAIDQGLYGSIPFGKKILNALFPEKTQMLQSSAERNPGFEAPGMVGGALGQGIAQPIYGAGKFAGAAGKGLANMLARNALNSSVYAAPGAIEQATEGDVGGAAKNFVRNAAIGTALGTGSEALLRKLPAILGTLKKSASAAAVREGLGIDPKSLRAAATIGGKLKSGAGLRGRTQDLESGLIDLMNKEGVVDEPSKEAWLALQKSKWQGVDKAFDESGAKASDFAEQIKSNPTVAAFLQEHGAQGEARLNDLLAKADQKAGIGDVRDFLQKRIDFYGKSPKDIIDADTGDVAKAIKSTIDTAFVPPELKADYSKYRAIDDALTREDFRLPKTFAANSLTAGRMLGSGIATGALGGVSGINPDDPDAMKKSLLRAGIGFAAGSVAPRIGSALANKLTGRLAAKIAPLIPRLSELGAGAGKVGGLVSRLGEQESAKTPSLVATGPELQPQTPSEAQSQGNVKQAEGTVTPEQAAAAKAATNSAWADTVRQKLDGMYDTYIAPQYGQMLSREDFIQRMDEMTNHFDPPLTAGAVFQDSKERDNYLKSYEAVLRLQGLQKQYTGGQDFVSEALYRDVLALFFRVRFSVNQYSLQLIAPKGINERIAYNELRDWAVSLMTEQGKAPAKTTIDQVSKDLDTIIAMRIPLERKRQLVIDHLQNYGLNVTKLMKYGQLGGLA